MSTDLSRLAIRYWDHYVASTSPVRAERLRVSEVTGELADVQDAALAVLDDTDAADEFLCLVIVAEQQLPPDGGARLAYLAAGPIEDAWHKGDHQLLSRLSGRGVSAAIIEDLDRGIWK